MSGKGNLSNQSTENAFAIFEYLIRQPEPLKLLEIAESLADLRLCWTKPQNLLLQRNNENLWAGQHLYGPLQHFPGVPPLRPGGLRLFRRNSLLLHRAQQPGFLHRHRCQLQPHADEHAADRKLRPASQHCRRKASLPGRNCLPSLTGSENSAFPLTTRRTRTVSNVSPTLSGTGTERSSPASALPARPSALPTAGPRISSNIWPTPPGRSPMNCTKLSVLIFKTRF